MAVAVQVNGFKFLFLSDDTLESQEEIAFALHQKWLPGHTRLLAVDVVILSHNSSVDDYSFEFISSFSPKMIICPIFFKEGHPSQTLYQSLKRIKSLQSSMPHKFYYYVKTTIEENGEDKEAFSKCEDSTHKLIFSLEHPISMMFNTTGGGYIRQFVPDPIPNSSD
nr:PREDICTED: uncharacterized protein LOC109041396 [Bemisia tabaci]